ncbi:MAG: hypothetical protein Q9163_005823 [Psora crenata]
MDIFTSKEKRRSLALPGRAASPSFKAKNSPKGSPNVAAAKPAKLAVEMESPPLLFHGTPTQSSGALLSGQLLLAVTDPEITMETFTMVLQAKVTTRKPVSKDCPACTTKITDLFSWKFLTEPKRLERGTHAFPFSYLLPGHLPATSHSGLGVIEYVLDAKAITTLADKITIGRTLTVQRALMPGMDKTSIRIFPPTNLTATVVLPSVIHPIGSFPVQMRLTGVIDNSIKNIQRRWRLRKMIWRIDEHSRVISAACPQHAHKIGGLGKGVLHEDTRTIGSEDLKSGWKTDFDAAGGEVEMEFSAVVKANSRPVCDVDSPTGLITSHNFILELIVAEEQTAKGGKYATPTGAARVLRMQFKLVLTERAGLGISWDEEMPPTYDDVPNSPPGYTKIDYYHGEIPPHDDEELERMGRSHGHSTTS